MGNEIHKVLIVAYLESSRPAAYEISSTLQEHGFSADFCYAPPIVEEGEEKKPESESQIKPDLYLTEKTDLAMYEGVIFVDDGNNIKACVSVAKQMDKAGYALGGYGHGCLVLYKAGLLKDKYICLGLPEDFSKGANIVNSPSVRSDNIVTAAGNCGVGFSFLMVDALGGKVKRTIESVKEASSDIPINTAFIISEYGNWAKYWPLAERLAEKDTTLIIADWQDIDLPSKTVQRFLAVGPHVKDNVAFVRSSYFMPNKIWMRKAIDNLTEATAVLSSLGIKIAMDTNDDDNLPKMMQPEIQDEERYAIILKELAHQNIWPQADGRLAINENNQVNVLAVPQAISRVKTDLNYLLKEFRANDNVNRTAAKIYARLVRRAVLRLRLIYELDHFSKFKKANTERLIKTADYAFDSPDTDGDYEYGQGTVPGPYSNVNEPARVLPWHQGDDWLEDVNGMDEQTIANLSRYHPDSKDGFFAEFDLWHQNDPTPWSDIEQGKGDYPMRAQLTH